MGRFAMWSFWRGREGERERGRAGERERGREGIRIERLQVLDQLVILSSSEEREEAAATCLSEG